MGRRTGSRALAVGSLAAGVAAAVTAVFSGLGAQTDVIAQAQAADTSAVASHSVAFGHARVRVRTQPTGRTCFSVALGTSTVARACAASVGRDEIAFAAARSAVGGVAGADVRAVIVKLTRKGTVWATFRRGAFYAAVPKRHLVRAAIAVLRDGSRHTFRVPTSGREAS